MSEAKGCSECEARRKQGAKCAVKLCPNRTTEGKFTGDVCTPCYMALMGKGKGPSAVNNPELYNENYSFRFR